VVTGCPKDSLDPRKWHLPIVGEVGYKGFFNRGDAEAEAARLEEEGLDTWIQPVMAFSTLGWLHDPIFSTVLQQSRVVVITVTLHELVHNTFYVRGDTRFNEQAATFVSEKGTLMFLVERFGRSSVYAKRARALFDDESMLGIFVEQLSSRLQAVYEQRIRPEDKLAERARIFGEARREFDTVRQKFHTRLGAHLADRTWNNATVVALGRYLAPPANIFQDIYRALGGDLRKMVSLLKDVPDGQDPWQYLTNRLAMLQGDRRL
jgi:predicted aminopeptidase